MKNKITLCIFSLCFIVIASCSKENKEAVFEFPKENIQSLSVYTYDTEHETTTSNRVYNNDDMDFLNYLQNLSGKKIDSIDINKLSDNFYGVELNAELPYTILFVDDYAITYEDEYFVIDGKEAAKMCQSIKGDSNLYFDASYILNHRYISIMDEQWITKYMKESTWNGEEAKNVQFIGVSSIDTDSEMLELTLENNTGTTIEYGSMIIFETLVDGVWYNIDNMTNDNINLAWTAELHILETGNSSENNFYLNFYQPLPIGTYRLIKEVTVDGKNVYMIHEFDIK